jgi:hypothetical protein
MLLGVKMTVLLTVSLLFFALCVVHDLVTSSTDDLIVFVVAYGWLDFRVMLWLASRHGSLRETSRTDLDAIRMSVCI